MQILLSNKYQIIILQEANETILLISLKKLEHNFNYLKSLVKNNTKIIAVVKAFGYGHGDIEISKKIEKLGVFALWVTDFEEGVILRKSGLKCKIIVANPGMKSYAQIIKNNLDVVIYNTRLLNLYCVNKKKVNVHIKFNTGMNRYGFEKKDLNNIILKLKNNAHLNVISVCSHLGCSDNIKKKNVTLKQLNKFNSITENFEKKIGYKTLKHILNTHGVINFPKYQMDMVRLGIGLYDSINNQNLQSISCLHSVVTQNRRVKKGESIGYGQSFIAKKEMNISIVPVGYADGLNRKLSNGIGVVKINNHICPIIGKISMDNFIVDTTNVLVCEGDIVEIFGETITVSLIADKIKTIPYEIYSILNRRIKRIYSD